jgi:Lrp/AsnC family transcriptional regulator for asnA, asnC and gidA
VTTDPLAARAVECDDWSMPLNSMRTEARAEPTEVDDGRSRSAPTLDALSLAIIEQLQQDGRRAYATIAAAVGLSEAAVRQRVQRLVSSGVVQIVAVTDPLQVGFHRQAMVGIRTEGSITGIVDALNDMPEVDYIVVTAGSFDVLAEVVCADDDHLLHVVSEQIRVIPGVRSTETFVYLKLSKQTYTWGTR